MMALTLAAAKWNLKSLPYKHDKSSCCALILENDETFDCGSQFTTGIII